MNLPFLSLLREKEFLIKSGLLVYLEEVKDYVPPDFAGAVRRTRPSERWTSVLRSALEATKKNTDDSMASVQADAPSSFKGSTLLGPDGKPLSSKSPEYIEIISEVKFVSSELLRRLAMDPRLWYELSPRRFEEVVAELLYRQGYEVTLTQMSRDGGMDIMATASNSLGTFLYLVECKKYAADHPVGVGLVRQLNGVVDFAKATAGILATTSYFTRDARELQQQNKYRLSLRDYGSLQEWLGLVDVRRPETDLHVSSASR